MRQELRSAFIGWRFPAACGLMLVCYLGFSVPEWMTSGSWGEYGSNALQQAVGGIFFGGILLLMPFCAAAVHAVSQVDEIRSGFIKARMIRGGVWRGAWRKISVAAIAGALAAALPFALHALLWRCIALPCNPALYPYHEMQFAGTLYNAWYGVMEGLPLYVSIFLGLGISGALWAVVGLAVAVWIPDSLLVVSIPVGLYFLWMRFASRGIFGLRLPPPDALFTEGMTTESLLAALAVHGLFFLSASLLYFIGLKRRAQDG